MSKRITRYIDNAQAILSGERERRSTDMSTGIRIFKRAALESLLYWAEANAYKGAGHPEEKPNIEARYLEAINKIERLLDIKESGKLPK